MNIFTEKEAEEFLDKESFEIVRRIFAKDEKELKLNLKQICFPVVMKISGREIIHKNQMNGVELNLRNFEQTLKAFKEFKKMKNFEGVIIQKQIQGKEFLLGVKKTQEFEHAISFGAGGIHTEELKDVSFRICPFNETEAIKMIKETNASKNLNEKNFRIIKKNLIKLCQLVAKYPKIKELDINPFIVGEKISKIVDARIVWE